MSIIESLINLLEEKEERIINGKRELVDNNEETGILKDKPEYTRNKDGSIERMSLKERTERSRAATLAANKTSTKVHRARSMEKRKSLIDC